ncbi:hypothetical protein BDC45DRAFT_316986 [Circinella umbellata]|nr:hypothetical protein BDC45DRAFT_316986 [Circinella umbellata]
MIIKLGLSRVVNFVNPLMKNLLLENLKKEDVDYLLRFNNVSNKRGMTEDVENTYDKIMEKKKDDEKDQEGNVIYNEEDVDVILSKIQMKKGELSRDRKRQTELYLVLDCMEYLLQSFDIWGTDLANNSETTFYRRFASLLDKMFMKTNVELFDGETGSNATKNEIENNKAIFFDTNTAPAYSRKIDLLVKCSEQKKYVEISSNEWKRSSCTTIVKTAQQSKNLRINAAILKNIKQYGVFDTMSLDMIGTSGYFSMLHWLPDQNIFFARDAWPIQMPTSYLSMNEMKNFINTLLIFKVYM